MSVFQTAADAQEVLKNPVNTAEIQKAKRKKIRTQVHTETITDQSEFTSGHRDLLYWIENEVLKDSEVYNQMKGVIKAPIPSNEITQSIFNQGVKIFKAEDRFIDFKFTDSSLELDAETYRKKIGDEKFWPSIGWDTYKSAIDSILIVDLPRLDMDEYGNFVMQSERPEPYYFILDVDKLYSIDVSRTKVRTNDEIGLLSYYRIEHIAYIINDNDYVVIDDEFYRVFKKDDGNYRLIMESRHNLGYCPAQSFWSTPLNSNSIIRKSNQITKSEAELDWYAAYTWFAKYLKLYAPFPIYAGYKPVCNYRHDHEGGRKTTCDNGYHKWTASDGTKMSMKCPKCSGQGGKPGPGKFLQVKAPQDPTQDPDLLKNPIVVVPAEKVSVETVNQELKDVEEKLWKNCVGFGDQILSKEDVNEKQVEAVTDNKAVILYNIRINFQIIHKFAIDTVFKIRYGDSYLGSTINYGGDYLPENEATVIESYKNAKESGLPGYDLQSRRLLLNKVKFKNNPSAMERIKILENLEPYPDMSFEEFRAFAEANPGIVSKEDFLLKANFNNFILRFEREIADIVQYGSLLNFDVKINEILSQLNDYTTEKLNFADPETEPTV